MNEISHAVFGSIKLSHHWWEGNREVIFFKKNIKVNIGINGKDNAVFEQTQIDAFKNFFNNIEKILLEAEKAIYSYYQEVCPDYRDRLEDSADEFAPIITSNEEVASLVQLTEVIFPWSFGKDVREIGLLLNCIWEPEHGLAVKFVNEEVVEVGYQDIVL